MEEEAVVIAVKARIAKRIEAFNLDQTAVNDWLAYDRKPKTWKKIEQNFPKAEEVTEWLAQTKLGKNLESLQKIKYPTLMGWSETEIYNALRPFIGKHAKKFSTPSCPVEECLQEAFKGIRNAIRTDAGMSVFAQHAFLHIKTKIRRLSAKSPTIANPENRPSTYAVRREISAWVGGWWVEHEAFRLAREGSSNKEIIDVKDFVAKTGEKSPSVLKKLLAKAEENLAELLEKGIPVNETNLARPEFFKEYRIQKIGQKGIKESMLRDELPLAFLDDKVWDLMEYLNWRFKTAIKGPVGFDRNQHSVVGDLVRVYATSPKFRDWMVPLDAPVDEGFSLEQAVEPEWSGFLERPPSQRFDNPTESVEKRDAQKHWRDVLQEVRGNLSLSLEQETVLVYVYGLDGKEPVNGSDLARNMGQYLGEMAQSKGLVVTVDKSKKVSRQRITQYIETLKKQITEVLFRVFFEDRGRDVSYAIQKADLTVQERAIAVALYKERQKRQKSVSDTIRVLGDLSLQAKKDLIGKDDLTVRAENILENLGTGRFFVVETDDHKLEFSLREVRDDQDIEFVAQNYSLVTGVGLPDSLDAVSRRAMVKDQFQSIKTKLVATCL